MKRCKKSYMHGEDLETSRSIKQEIIKDFKEEFEDSDLDDMILGYYRNTSGALHSKNKSLQSIYDSALSCSETKELIKEKTLAALR
jgi:hypothetical protein